MTERAVKAACVAAAALAATLLVVNALAVRAGRPLFDVIPVTYRYWEDVRAGAASVRGTGDGAFVPASADPFTHAVGAEAARRGIGVASFWRAIPVSALPPPATGRLTALEDVGRARLLGVCFRALGGVAPYLLLWVPALLAFPALGALALAFAAVGRPWAGIVLSLLVGASAFFADALFLSYSPVGFYVVGLFLLAALSAWSAGAGPLRTSALAAALLAGLVLALCAACRGGVLLLLPGFVAAGAVLMARTHGDGRWRAAAIVALLVLPSLALRPSESHNLWISVWQGLGDFDRARGHSWSDAEAKRTLRAAGVDDLRSPQAEETMRALVLADVRADPAWYGGILVRRLRAVFLQEKIAPRGHALAPANGPGEGAMDAYYGLSRHADTFAVGASAVEVPTWMLWAPLALLVVLRPRDLLALMPLAIGALGVPILISTAGALETQAFVIVPLAAVALLLDGAARAIGVRRSVARAGSAAPTAAGTA